MATSNTIFASYSYGSSLEFECLQDTLMARDINVHLRMIVASVIQLMDISQAATLTGAHVAAQAFTAAAETTHRAGQLQADFWQDFISIVNPWVQITWNLYRPWPKRKSPYCEHCSGWRQHWGHPFDSPAWRKFPSPCLSSSLQKVVGTYVDTYMWNAQIR